MGTIPFDPRRALPAPPGFPADWDPYGAPARPPEDLSWWDKIIGSFAPDFANPGEHDPDPRAFGAEPDEWAAVHDRFESAAAADKAKMDAEKAARDAEERSKIIQRMGYPGLAAPSAPPRDANTVTPPGTAGAGSGGTGIAADPTMNAWWNNGKDNAFHPDIADLGDGLSRYSSPGGRTTWDVPAHEGVDPSGAPTHYGSITASMDPGWTPGHEDLTGLKRHAVNAADFQVPNPVPPPPVPTTVTSARFDQKEGFVPLGPPTGAAGVRESYQGVPTDPEAERQRRLEREAQDLQLEEMRQKVRDPYGKERFESEQRRGDLVKKAEIDRMTEEERRKSFATVMKQLDDEAAARIEAASRKPPSKERDAMIEAIRQRVESAKEAQRQAFGIGARLSSSELYKTNPYQ